MPRAKQQGKIGQAYQNRTDLNEVGRPTPATTPGQEYGKQAAQMSAMQAVPPAQGGTPAPTMDPSMQTPQMPGAQEAMTPNVMQTPMAPKPGDLLWDHPTERPSEPLSHNPNLNEDAYGMQQTGVAILLKSLASTPGAPPQLSRIAQLAEKVAKGA